MPMYETIFAKRLADVGKVVELSDEDAKNLVRWGRLKPVDDVAAEQVPARRRRRADRPAKPADATDLTSDEADPDAHSADAGV